MQKNNILKRVLSCLGAVIITALALVLPFASKVRKKQLAFADTVTSYYSFVASDMYHMDVYTSRGTNVSIYPCLFSSNMSYDGNYFRFQPYFNYMDTSGLTLTYTNCAYFKIGNTIYDAQPNIAVNRGTPFRVYTAPITSDLNMNSSFAFDIYVDSDFNCNIYKISLYLSDIDRITTSPNANFKFLNISYFDVNENSCTFSFMVAKNLIYSTRTYYVIGADDFTDNQIYQNGYQAGLNANQDNIYNDGYQAGQTNGYNSGYNAGINASNNYTFTSLIGAVIDVPVRAFTSLFNFDLLGVNLASFFGSLLAVAVIITVVKIII